MFSVNLSFYSNRLSGRFAVDTWVPMNMLGPTERHHFNLNCGWDVKHIDTLCGSIPTIYLPSSKNDADRPHSSTIDIDIDWLMAVFLTHPWNPWLLTVELDSVPALSCMAFIFIDSKYKPIQFVILSYIVQLYWIIKCPMKHRLHAQ